MLSTILVHQGSPTTLGHLVQHYSSSSSPTVLWTASPRVFHQWLSMSTFSRQSRFMRSMTPSGSVKMSTSRFNLVCGKTSEQATRPNLDRIPNPQGPKIIDARVTTPTMSRRDFSQPRDTYSRPPAPPTRDSSLYLPFGSYAEMGVHTKAPARYEGWVLKNYW